MSGVSDIRETNADSIVSKMDEVVKKAGSAISGTKRSETVPPTPDDTNSPVLSKSKRPDKHSMDYMVRSGIAGGIAGCAVSSLLLHCNALVISAQRKWLISRNRPKHPSHLSIALKSSSKPATPNLRNTRAHGSASRGPCVTYMGAMESWDYSAVTLRPS